MKNESVSVGEALPAVEATQESSWGDAEATRSAPATAAGCSPGNIQAEKPVRAWLPCWFGKISRRCLGSLMQ
eukprot:g9111.t1